MAATTASTQLSSTYFTFMLRVILRELVHDIVCETTNIVFTIALATFWIRDLVHMNIVLTIIIDAWFISTTYLTKVVHIVPHPAQDCPEPTEHHSVRMRNTGYVVVDDDAHDTAEFSYLPFITFEP
jgi:hypothetical protein